MRSMGFRITLLIIVLLEFTGGCSTLGFQQVHQEPYCMPPSIDEFAYPVQYIISHVEKPIIPPPPEQMPSWWEKAGVIPNDIYSSAYQFAFQGGNKIWVTDLSNTTISQLRIYTSNSKTYQIKNKDGRLLIPLSILVSHDDIVWVVTWDFTPRDDKPDLLALAYFNEQDDYFETVIDQDSLFNRPIQFKPEGKLKQNTKGDLFFLIDGSLATYNYRTNKASILLNSDRAGGTIEEFSIGVDGNIWFVLKKDFTMREFNPITGKVHEYPFPPPYNKNESAWQKSIYADNKGRIWYSNFGWLEKEGDEYNPYLWYQIIVPNLFLAYGPGRYYVKYFLSGGVVQQFSDGGMWYYSEPGIIRLDPVAGTWCRKAPSNHVYEDNYHNIWTYYRGGIYRYIEK